MKAIWSSLLLGSGLISNWIMSPRGLSNQVLKSLQGQYPTDSWTTCSSFLSSLLCIFFSSNCIFPSAYCDYGLFPFTVHPCELSVCIFYNSIFGNRILQTDTPLDFRLIKPSFLSFSLHVKCSSSLNPHHLPLDSLQFLSISFALGSPRLVYEHDLTKAEQWEIITSLELLALVNAAQFAVSLPLCKVFR